uniref:Uncharacterized protein n=1 Tax=Manihot esculenta TaxID=3983 RepID=A0A199UB51_MANES
MLLMLTNSCHEVVFGAEQVFWLNWRFLNLSLSQH